VYGGEPVTIVGYLMFMVLCMPRTSVTTASSATACHNKRLKTAVDRLTCEKVAAAQTVLRRS
jgi:hypothetical protein